MHLRRLEAPAAAPIDRAAVRLQLQLLEGEAADQDPTIDRVVKGVVRHLDGASGNLGRCLISQKWALDLDRFPNRALSVPLPPLISVDAIRYVDPAGVTQTVDPAVYLCHPGDEGLVELLCGAAWPTPRRQSRAVSIEFTAGYGSTAADVPEDIVSALLLMAADLFKNRESSVEGTISSEIKMTTTIENLLVNYRIRTITSSGATHAHP